MLYEKLTKVASHLLVMLWKLDYVVVHCEDAWIDPCSPGGWGRATVCHRHCHGWGRRTLRLLLLWRWRLSGTDGRLNPGHGRRRRGVGGQLAGGETLLLLLLRQLLHRRDGVQLQQITITIIMTMIIIILTLIKINCFPSVCDYERLFSDVLGLLWNTHTYLAVFDLRHWLLLFSLPRIL